MRRWMTGGAWPDFAGLAVVAVIVFAVYGLLVFVRGNRERDALERVCSIIEDAQENGNDDRRLRPAVRICDRFGPSQ